MTPNKLPALVALDVWGIPTRSIPKALFNVATGPRKVSGYPGLTFAKFLGTASSPTFAPQDTDIRHWVVLTCWDAPHAAATFERSGVAATWRSMADERLSLSLTPLSSHGRWSKQEPFGKPEGSPEPGPVAAITRARLRPRTMATFMRAVPPVAAQLTESPGVMVAMGIGESPVGLQGTLSLWDSTDSLRAFAYNGIAHRSAIEQTSKVGWYTEELFARFYVRAASGSYRGVSIDIPPAI